MTNSFNRLFILGLLMLSSVEGFAQEQPHNLILFVADGLRPGVLNEKTAPAMTALVKVGKILIRFFLPSPWPIQPQ